MQRKVAFFKSWDEKEGEIKINFCFNELQHKWVKGFEMTPTGYAGSYYIIAKKVGSNLRSIEWKTFKFKRIINK
jgi:hypothetical protein